MGEQWQPSQPKGISSEIPISMPERQWNPLLGLQPPKNIREFKGLNLMDPFSIEDGFATEIENLSSKLYPSLSTADSFVRLRAFTGLITGLGVRKDTDLLVLAGGSMSVLRSDGTWTDNVGALSATAQCSFTNFKGNFSDYNLLIANGVDPVQKFDGTTLSALTNAPAGGKYIDSHDNRVYCAVGNSIKFCALRKAEDWTSVDDAGEIVLETKEGEDISGIKAGPGHLVVFTPHTTYELYGNGPTNYRMMNVSEKIGCVSNASAVMAAGVLYFLGHDGIYQYAGGSIPKKEFSLPIQALIDQISVDDRSQCVGGTYLSKYYLTIPSSPGNFDTILEYDTIFKTWHVWKTSDPTKFFATLKEVFYQGTNSGKVNKLGNSAAGVTWKWVSKPIGFGAMASQHRWYRMWGVVDLPAGSTLDVFLSPDPRGENWTSVYSFTADVNVQSKQILIPLNVIVNTNWARVKLVGTGPCTLHEIAYQERIMPMGQG